MFRCTVLELFNIKFNRHRLLQTVVPVDMMADFDLAAAILPSAKNDGDKKHSKKRRASEEMSVNKDGGFEVSPKHGARKTNVNVKKQKVRDSPSSVSVSQDTPLRLRLRKKDSSVPAPVWASEKGMPVCNDKDTCSTTKRDKPKVVVTENLHRLARVGILSRHLCARL